jgi:hypothetical protein
MNPIITKITDDWIIKNNPCREAVDDWWDKKEREPIKILKLLIKDEKYHWANWFIARVMEYKDYVSCAVFAAESVINIYEKKYPDDKRPREAIDAAKKCIKYPSKKNNAVAYAADAADAAYAAYAAYAAAHAADAVDAADVADAADAAAHAADAAAHAAAHAADAAAHAAHAADAADAARAAHAAHAAYAAYAAAHAAAHAAVAAYAAAHAAVAADAAAHAAYAAYAAMELKILKYGMKLLGE